MREIDDKDYQLFSSRGLMSNSRKNLTVDNMSQSFTRLEDSFNAILAYSKNIIQLTPKAVTKSVNQPSTQLDPAQPIVNTESLIGQLTLLNKQINLLSQKLSLLDLGQQTSDIDVDLFKTGKKLKRGKIPKSLKVMGALGVGLDVADRFMDGQSAGQMAAGVGGGLVGGAVGGKLLGSLGASAGPIGGIVGSVIGSTAGYIGGGYLGDKLYDKFADKTNKTIDKALASKSQADGRVNDNEPSSQFASYLKTTTEMISKTMPALGIVGSVASAASSFAGGFQDGLENVETVPPNEAVNKAMAYFQSQGWSKEQSAGLVGNLQVESGNFSPDVVSGKRRGDGGKAVGIAQWHPDRQAQFKSRFGRNLVGSSLQQQLEFIQWELNNNEKGAGKALKGAKSAEEAAAIVDRLYERSSGQHRRQRMANARRLISADTMAQKVGQAVGQGASFVQEKVGGGGFMHPVAPATLGSRFGPRWGRMHKGQDYPVPMGTPVAASNPGVVTFAGSSGAYGSLIKIQHPDGTETRYAHLSRILVRVGNNVTKGQTIGQVGSTGRSTGPHLHFEILKGGKQVDPLTMIGGGGTRVPENVAERGTEPDVAKRQAPNSKGVSTGDFLKEQANSQSAGKGAILIVNKNSPAPQANKSKGAGREKSGGAGNPAAQYRKYFTG